MSKAWILPTHIVATAGVVRNAKGEILMINGRQGWVFPGGQVEEGETLIDGLKREIMEETGIEVKVGQVFCISSNTGKYPGYNGVKEIPTKIMLDFVCWEVGGQARPSEENSETVYMPESLVLDKMTAPAMVERFKAYLGYDGRPTYLAYVTKPSFELQLKMKI